MCFIFLMFMSAAMTQCGEAQRPPCRESRFRSMVRTNEYLGALRRCLIINYRLFRVEGTLSHRSRPTPTIDVINIFYMTIMVLE